MVTLTSCAEFASVWGELCRGRLKYRHTVFAEDCIRAHFEGTDTEDAPGTATDVDRLRRLLLGATTKEIGLHDGVAPATVTVGARRALSRMGVTTSGVFSAPIVFAVAAAAYAKNGVHTPIDKLTAGVSVDVVMLPPVPPAARALSPLEVTFFRLTCEGLRLSDMAKMRSCSERTVAVVLARMYSKLGIAGRRDVVALVAQMALEREAQTSSAR